MGERDRPAVFFVVQPTVAHYREPLLRHLRESTAIDVDFHGRFANSETSAADRIHPASEDVLSEVTPIRFSTLGRLWWEHGQVRAVWSGSHDVYVLAGRIYTVSAWVALLAGRLRGRTVLLWGHGWKRAESGLKLRLRRAFYALASGLLVYGDRAKELGISYGVPAAKIEVVYNSIYDAERIGGAHTIGGEARRRSEDVSTASSVPAPAPMPAQDPASAPAPGPAPAPARPGAPEDRFTIIYCSRLTARHRLDLLADALAEYPAEGPQPFVLIVGEGAERPRLERKFADNDVDAEFTGACYDDAALRELYGRADVAASIGGAGLNVIQALGFGVPVIAEADHRDSSPEIEAVVERETGRYFQAGDAASLRAVLRELIDDPAQVARLGRRGVEMIGRRYSAQRHASAMEQAILRLRRRRRRR